jgi:hypothetical protein
VRRPLTSFALLAVAFVAVPATSLGAGTTQQHAFSSKAYGAFVTSAGTPEQLLLKTRSDLTGAGAAVLVVTAQGNSGTAKGTEYNARGSFDLTLRFKVADAGSDGLSRVTGTGKIVGGALAYDGAKGAFKVAGTRTVAGVTRLTLAGKVRYAPTVAPVGSGRGQ